MNNHTYHHIMLLLLLASSITRNADIRGCPGCYQKGTHLQEEYDTKDYRRVDCACVCTTLRGNHNKCTECGHIHIPSRVEFVDACHVVDTGTTEGFALYLEEPTKELSRYIALQKANTKKSETK